MTTNNRDQLRDHLELGVQTRLFHIDDVLAPVEVFWNSKGFILHRIIENYIRQKTDERGYLEVKTPMAMDRSLWEKSGLWEEVKKHKLYSGVSGKLCDEYSETALKPVHCPCHVQIYKQQIMSYRDLPFRIFELGGLTQTPGLTPDDAHIFCTRSQMKEEIKGFCSLLREVYKDFGFEDIKIKFSDRPDKRAGTDETWDEAEQALEQALQEIGDEYTINKGEGAFYGPKLEFVLKDAIGRYWPCGMIQVDFVLPERLDAYYIKDDGRKDRPVILHHAILGNLESFICILIEHYSGIMPLWLALVQIALLTTITNDFDEYGKDVLDRLSKAGLRVIYYKMERHFFPKVPILCILGAKERKEGSISYRCTGSDKTQTCTIDDFIKKVLDAVQKKEINI